MDAAKRIQIIQILSEGGGNPLDRLFPLIDDELRQLAASQLTGDHAGQALQPTAIVNELYLQLAEGSDAMDSAHKAKFLAAAAASIRRILVDHARKFESAKRTADRRRVTLDTPVESSGRLEMDVLELDEAMSRLGAQDPRREQIAELRLFGGLDANEIADIVGIPRTSIVKEWRFARAWLSRAIAVSE